MNRILLILFFCLTAVAGAFAQPQPDTAEKRKELQEFKVKYFIQEIDLPADKQPEFTRLYNQYDQSREALFAEMGSRFKAMRAKDEPTDADYLVTAEAMAGFKSREGELEKNFFQQLKTLLTPKQLFQLKKAEHKFQRKVMEMQKPRHKKKK
ncbi:MAG: hypothetical protein J6L73_02555 [Muribaculaceae bacterium]|nr:hypothetical protein [Muribaculaceae bacterium]